ncbi:unnamed protein product [Schistosoma turkestanicum]|nr:unnamed protein product [Schistosoma turkestanicum]
MVKQKHSVNNNNNNDNNNPTNISPIHHHMNLLHQQITVCINSKSSTLGNESFTALLCRMTGQNLKHFSRKSQTRLSCVIRRSLCKKCLIPLELFGKIRIRKRQIRVCCSLCHHQFIITYPILHKWHRNYLESILPDSLCYYNETIEKCDDE